MIAGLKILSLGIDYFLDNNPEKLGKTLLNVKIEHPNILEREEKENIVIIISSMFFTDISFQLDQMGFKESVHYFSVFKSTEKKQQMKNEARHKRILNGVEIGKYSYGAEKHCYPIPLLNSVGAIN